MKNNPYVGPRPYERGDRRNFYGRKREARDLSSLILGERVVLFYAPSGAGKTSLLNAQVIPTLEENDFHVLFENHPNAGIDNDNIWVGWGASAEHQLPKNGIIPKPSTTGVTVGAPQSLKDAVLVNDGTAPPPP